MRLGREKEPKRQNEVAPLQPLSNFSESMVLFNQALEDNSVSAKLVKIGMSGLESAGYAEAIQPKTLYETLSNLAIKSRDHFIEKGNIEDAEACSALVDRYATALEGFTDTDVWKAPKKPNNQTKAKS